MNIEDIKRIAEKFNVPSSKLIPIEEWLEQRTKRLFIYEDFAIRYGMDLKKILQNKN